MLKNKKNKLAILSLGIFFALFFTIIQTQFVLAQTTAASTTTGCCVYNGGEGGCVDGWIKEKCGGDTGLIGSLMVSWRENTECKKIEACLATWDEPLPLAIPIAGTVNINSLGEYIQTVYNWSIGAISIIAVVMIMIAGFQWISSAGDEKAIGGAKERIKNAIFGLVVIGVSYLLLQLVNPATLSLKMPGVVKIAKVEQETDTAPRPCDPKKYPDVYCGEIKIINQDSCMGTKCEESNTVCLLEFNNYGYLTAKNGCVSSMSSNEFDSAWSNMIKSTYDAFNVTIDTGKCGTWMFGDSTLANAVVGGVGAVSTGLIIPTGGLSLIAAPTLSALIGNKVLIGSDCSRWPLSSSTCYLLRKENGKYKFDEKMESMESACCAGDSDCFYKVKSDLNIKSKDEYTCAGQYNLSFTNKALCGEYYYDTETRECKFGAGCTGADTGSVCLKETDMVPTCKSLDELTSMSLSIDGNCVTGFDSCPTGQSCIRDGAGFNCITD
ncbi:MAG: pilin [Patescibacteria group bacterium]